MIAIIDYGMGNLRSVQKAFEYLGFEAEITKDKVKVEDADRVVLPGVGAFSDAMDNLHRMGMLEIIYGSVDSGKPFLGICLGMQLLFDKSFEGGIHQGLGLIPGEVKRIPARKGLKVPHMGWNHLECRESPILDSLGPNPSVYFVHSYYVEPVARECIIGTTDYSMEITAAVQKDNIFGLQFHPEKSGDTGLLILKNFGGLK